MRSKRHFRVNKVRRLIWTASKIEIDVNTGSTPLEQIIGQITDWSGATGNVPATLMAIRGWLTARPLTTVNQNYLSQGIIVKTDVDDAVAVLDPQLLATYVNEQILWTCGFSYKGEAATVSTTPAHYFDIDVKAKRKLTAGTNIRFVVAQETGAAATKWAGLMRCLYSY